MENDFVSCKNREHLQYRKFIIEKTGTGTGAGKNRFVDSYLAHKTQQVSLIGSCKIRHYPLTEPSF